MIRRLGFSRRDGTCAYFLAGAVVVAVTWVPLMVLALIHQAVTGQAPRLLEDWSVHARLLVAIPLFFKGESSLHVRSGWCIDILVSEGWAGDDVDEVQRIVDSTGRLRDARLPELLLLGIVVAVSQVALWEGGGLAAITRRLTLDPQATVARYWYVAISVPVFQFLLLRWVWRWVLWTQLLWRISRLRLRPIATHPDLAGGLGFLVQPVVGFSYVVAAISAVQAGLWGDKVFFEGAGVQSFRAELAVLVVAAVVLTAGPLVFFTGQLWRCRFLAIRQYDRLAAEYTRRFHRRWIETRERDDLLGTPDLQSLADLGGSYDVISRMRLLPFGPRLPFVIAAAVIVPMIPLVLIDVPVAELSRRLWGAVMGAGLR